MLLEALRAIYTKLRRITLLLKKNAEMAFILKITTIAIQLITFKWYTK